MEAEKIHIHYIRRRSRSQTQIHRMCSVDARHVNILSPGAVPSAHEGGEYACRRNRERLINATLNRSLDILKHCWCGYSPTCPKNSRYRIGITTKRGAPSARTPRPPAPLIAVGCAGCPPGGALHHCGAAGREPPPRRRRRREPRGRLRAPLRQARERESERARERASERKR